LRRLVLLTRSCGGLGADREEKQVTTRGERHDPDTTNPEQLDLNDPNQRREGSENHGAFLVAGVDQLEEEVTANGLTGR
jgi:hypothetical protein